MLPEPGSHYLLPFGTRSRFLFKMDFAEADYIVWLRSWVKGHLSYGEIAWEMKVKMEELEPEPGRLIQGPAVGGGSAEEVAGSRQAPARISHFNCPWMECTRSADQAGGASLTRLAVRRPDRSGRRAVPVRCRPEVRQPAKRPRQWRTTRGRMATRSRSAV